MKRLLLLLLLASPVMAQHNVASAEIGLYGYFGGGQTNTFCAANLACTVNGAWTFAGSTTFTGLTGITNSGVFTNTQMNEYMTSSINGFNPATEAHALFSASTNFTEGASFGAIVPNTAATTLLQVNGVGGYVFNNVGSGGTPAVGVFGSGRIGATNARVWGGNFVGSDQPGTFSSNSMYGNENDCFVSNVASLCTATLAEGFWGGGIQPTTSYAFRVGQPGGAVANAHWSAGLRCDQDATITPDGNNACVFILPVASGNSQNSQGLSFISTNSGGGQPVGLLYQLPAGDLQFTPNTASGFICNTCNSIRPGTANATDLGSTALPFVNLWLGTAATNNFKFQPAATAAARVITLADPLQTTVALPMTIVSGSHALNTASITTATCDAGLAVTATGTLATDAVDWSFNAAPTATNKYGAFLVVYAVPSANTVTFYTCNPSATTSTPTAMTVNFSVRRP